jgi:rRNA maturation RNase YbeY
MPENNRITFSNDTNQPLTFSPEDYAISVCHHLTISDYEIDITFIDGDKMIEMNTQYKQHNYDTDILTFDLTDDDDDTLQGDIYISVSEAHRNATEFNESVERELKLYIIHGILHLLGYDDTNEAAKEKMDATQTAILEAI